MTLRLNKFIPLSQELCHPLPPSLKEGMGLGGKYAKALNLCKKLAEGVPFAGHLLHFVASRVFNAFYGQLPFDIDTLKPSNLLGIGNGFMVYDLGEYVLKLPYSNQVSLGELLRYLGLYKEYFYDFAIDTYLVETEHGVCLCSPKIPNYCDLHTFLNDNPTILAEDPSICAQLKSLIESIECLIKEQGLIPDLKGLNNVVIVDGKIKILDLGTMFKQGTKDFKTQLSVLNNLKQFLPK